MRDPARIDPAVERLRAAWKANPDLRLGQLVFNAAHTARALTPPCPTLFYMEDSELLDGLDSAGWMCDVCGCWNPQPGRCKYHDEEHERYEADLAEEAYTPEQISAAYAVHGSPDDWGVKAFYEGGLLAALRGEYDHLRAGKVEAE